MGELTLLKKNAGTEVKLSLKPNKKDTYTAYQNISVKIGTDEYKYSEARLRHAATHCCGDCQSWLRARAARAGCTDSGRLLRTLSLQETFLSIALIARVLPTLPTRFS